MKYLNTAAMTAKKPDRIFILQLLILYIFAASNLSYSLIN
jgi:hypothetical protein